MPSSHSLARISSTILPAQRKILLLILQKYFPEATSSPSIMRNTSILLIRIKLPKLPLISLIILLITASSTYKSQPGRIQSQNL
jgi:hypothetical protein